MSLEGRTMIVTGGNSGIGAEIVRAAGRAGANIVIDYIANPEETERLAREVEDLGGRAVGVEADVTKPDDLHAMIRKAVDTFGGLDVLVNNAGMETRTSLLETSVEDFDRVMDVNLKSVFFGAQAAARYFIDAKREGLIINISSVHEEWPMPGNTAYCVAKGGLRMLTRTAGVELGDKGVRMINVGPGAVATPINRSTMDDPDKLAALEDSIPLGRMARPQEIGELVAMLATSAAGYLTATTVFADGGIMQGSVGL
ncbi:glucose 1-dehydrogenase [Dietzia alimentaria]|uniref:glucose 1-dehydrogenase n=1 Tax=Dietzia alimentaria TaxID=665550 RepID=UPI00029B262A|nr:glucose 1-dehydrogenase [Dietzia alimentaria]